MDAEEVSNYCTFYPAYNKLTQRRPHEAIMKPCISALHDRVANLLCNMIANMRGI